MKCPFPMLLRHPVIHYLEACNFAYKLSIPFLTLTSLRLLTARTTVDHAWRPAPHIMPGMQLVLQMCVFNARPTLRAFINSRDCSSQKAYLYWNRVLFGPRLSWRKDHNGAGYLETGGVHVVPQITPCRWPLALCRHPAGPGPLHLRGDIWDSWNFLFHFSDTSLAQFSPPSWDQMLPKYGEKRRDISFSPLTFLTSTPLFSRSSWKLKLDSQGRVLSWSPAAYTAVGSATALGSSRQVPKAPGQGQGWGWGELHVMGRSEDEWDAGDLWCGRCLCSQSKVMLYRKPASANEPGKRTGRKWIISVMPFGRRFSMCLSHIFYVWQAGAVTAFLPSFQGCFYSK